MIASAPWPVIRSLIDGELKSAAPDQQARDLRRLASLRDVMRVHGEATTADVLELYDRASALDPGHFQTQIERARMALDLGDLSRARAAADQALKVATTEQEHATADRALGEVGSAPHDFTGARQAFDDAIADLPAARRERRHHHRRKATWRGRCRTRGDPLVLTSEFNAARGSL